MNSSNRGRIAERLKTALIILLTVSALLLGSQTRLFDDFINSIALFKSVSDFFNSSPVSVEPPAGTVTKEAARPLCIVVTDEEGKRYGVKYDTAVKNTLYDRTGGVLGEALGSALIPSVIEEAEWREALTSQGIYFEYMTAVRLDVLCGWFGAPSRYGGNYMIRRVCVTFGEDTNRLYFQDEESGLFYSAETASSGGAPELGTLISDEGILFAFETGIMTAAENAPYMLILPDSSHPTVRISGHAAPQELLDIILAAFGENSRNYSTYTDPDGALNYVGTQFTIRVTPDGHALYRRAEGTGTTLRTLSGEGDLIERARIVVADTIGKSCGDAEVYFNTADYSYTGSGTVTFSYHLAGGLVHLSDAYAARVTIDRGIITELELSFLHFETTGENIGLLPEKQTLAAAGGEFILSYTVGDGDRLVPSWVNRYR